MATVRVIKTDADTQTASAEYPEYLDNYKEFWEDLPRSTSQDNHSTFNKRYSVLPDIKNTTQTRVDMSTI